MTTTCTEENVDRPAAERDVEAAPVAPRALTWDKLARVAQLYLVAVILGGGYLLVAWFPQTYPRPVLFAMLVISSCLTSVWKVNLPIPLLSGSTLSMSYAANLMALLLLGPRHTVIVGVAGAWAQCTYRVRQPYPLYRTVFSIAAEAITMVATGLVYGWLGGSLGSLGSLDLAKPLVGAIATYFLVNTGLVAGAIAFSTGRRLVRVWCDDFQWSGVSFMVAGSAGAMAAVIVDRGEYWQALLMLAPVHLTYRTYQLFVDRLDDQKRHVAETRRLHKGTTEALRQARETERAPADEK